MDDIPLPGARFLARAQRLALDHLARNERLVSYHAALVVKGGAILSEGVNKKKRNRFVKIHRYPDFSGIHSELDACMRAVAKSGDISGATVYVVRVLKDRRTTSLSKPCPACLDALRSYGIKKVVFSLNGGGFAAERL